MKGNGLFVLRPGGLCRMPPGVRHEISNPSKTDEAFFLLVQASQEGFDYVPVPFRTLEAALPFSPRT
jgi:quercetin dioxygenase-like cupin family protein